MRGQILTCSLVGALCEDFWCSESRSSSSGSHLLFSLFIKKKNNIKGVGMMQIKKEKKTQLCECVYRLPGQADVAHTVSHVAATGEALLYAPLGFLTAALGPGRREAPAD